MNKNALSKENIYILKKKLSNESAVKYESERKKNELQTKKNFCQGRQHSKTNRCINPVAKRKLSMWREWEKKIVA